MAEHTPVWIGSCLCCVCAYCNGTGADPGGGMCRACVGVGWHVLENEFSIGGHDDGGDDDEDDPDGEPPDTDGPAVAEETDQIDGQLTVDEVIAEAEKATARAASEAATNAESEPESTLP